MVVDHRTRLIVGSDFLDPFNKNLKNQIVKYAFAAVSSAFARAALKRSSETEM